MNEIEQMFFNAYVRYDNGWRLKNKIKPIPVNSKNFLLHPQYRYAGYIMDFLYTEKNNDNNNPALNVCIEIDGQESHKTKEQRLNDYRRERFLQSKGFRIVRFTASEVFVDADACIKEFMDIINTFHKEEQSYIEYGYEIEKWCQNECWK
jgi:very-short-patch-repair endonuclease